MSKFFEKFLTSAIDTAIDLVFNSFIVLIAWNAFMPEKFGLPHLSYPECVVLCVIGFSLARK